MDTLLSFLIAFAVTLFFVRRYVKHLAASKKPVGKAAHAAAPAVMKTFPCPRCGKAVGEGSAFCAACGAALSIWNIHRAEVQAPSNGAAEKGKPRPVINASLCIGCGSCADACPETGTLELAGGKAILAHPERCTGHAKCLPACPTSAITLAFGNLRQTIRVPSVNAQFETNVTGMFIVGELGGFGLIKTAINEGKLVIDHLRRRLEESGQWTPPEIEHNHDDRAAAPPPAGTAAREADPAEPFHVVIVGAGPAGLSASLTAHQYGLRYLTLEQGEIAATIRNYPRHKFLMAEPIEMPLYGNLYIGDGAKETLLAVWETIIANTGVRVRTNERVENVKRDQDLFVLETPKNRYRAAHVVLALGKRGTPRRLGVPGEELSKVAYRLIEAETYSNNEILVVGGGDSAVEAALAVSKAGRNRTALCYRGEDFSRVRERNQSRLQEAETEGRLKVLRKSHVQEIRPNSVLIASNSENLELPNDYVFVMIGGESPEEFLRKTGVEIVEKAISA